MAAIDLNSKIKSPRWGRSNTAVSFFGWSPRWKTARQGKVVDCEDIGTFVNLDTVDLNTIGLKQVYEVWTPVFFEITNGGRTVKALTGAIPPATGVVRFIGR